ncbi:response regulator [Prochlorothrix hollandica]|uniref:Chemotaxis protein CheY n=1 Tax=Prochlorothrix hollandica PCC 9006 = CALU 1027 TaxID=317619 RepID=A0A0M2Q2S9_PROHO|nr:response regulator [Prochlorothrix hollandica]KKJ00897.1 chemotaxis protein CheY [Prochlorothrix hollandica PCC 9006 = CALU 1027]
MQPTPELAGLLEQLQSLRRPPKFKMLVVDDEPDNLDLLYRTFRRQFDVYRAESGAEALDILANKGEVAVIISDQRMPEMKGTEFLSKTVPQFPNTVRIILTGFTDVEDLVDAINSGQVYRYITKPWDPEAMKVLVERALNAYRTQCQRIDGVERAETQTDLIQTIFSIAKTASTITDCLEPMAQILGEYAEADTCIFQLTANKELTGEPGCYGVEPDALGWLAQDTLVEGALTTQLPQGCLDVSQDDQLSGLSHYQEQQISAHLVFPLVYRQRVLAVLSLQWRQVFPLDEGDLSLLYLAIQQVILALMCTTV